MKINTANCAILLSLFISYSSQYVELNVEDNDLCSLIKKRKIKLDKGPASGLIVRQRQLNNHYLDWEKNFRCKFQVTPATSREGIIAVIQELIFRKNSTTDECIDYIQFTRKDGSTSQKFCGRFNAAIHMDHNFIDPKAPISSGNSVVDERGELDVVIFVAKDRLAYDEMNLSIVFTAYKKCYELSRKDTNYKPCSLVNSEYCIYSGFFSDSYINCPLPDCKDESGCLKPEIMDGTQYDGNKVLIAALSTVCIMFLIFILCLWICKTYKIFCWSQSFANPSSSTPQEQAVTPRVIEMNVHQTGSSETQGNSSSANRIDEDKDLPPSYDSLFPTR